jgi:hypothetical protein
MHAVCTFPPPSPTPGPLPCSARLQVELLCRVATLLLRLHMQQVMRTPSARPLLIQQQQLLLHLRVQELKDVMGFNLAAMAHLQRGLRERQAQPGGDLAATAAAGVVATCAQAAGVSARC